MTTENLTPKQALERAKKLLVDIREMKEKAKANYEEAEASLKRTEALIAFMESGCPGCPNSPNISVQTNPKEKT